MKKYIINILAIIVLSPLILAVVVYAVVDFVLNNTVGRLFNWAAKVVNNE